MPRIPHSLLHKAHAISPLLTLLVRATRDLPSAITELRWLTTHIREVIPPKNESFLTPYQKHVLLQLCRRRQSAEPLQYILGSQPFGDLEIKCRKGVLIPRPETEAYTEYLAELLQKGGDRNEVTEGIGLGLGRVNILDLCSGSGCISLLLHHLLLNSEGGGGVKVVGIDISDTAIALANENIDINLNKANRTTIRFDRKDVLQLTPQELKNSGPFNLIICNPPYIRTSDPSVSRSVRKWEPGLALYPLPRPNDTALTSSSQEVQVEDEDIFYHKVLSLAAGDQIDKTILLEIGSKDQAMRVVRLATQLCISPKDIVQIWRDWPDQKPETGEDSSITIDGNPYTVKGSGLYRSVAIRRFGEPLL